jgi:hypothetical protein
MRRMRSISMERKRTQRIRRGVRFPLHFSLEKSLPIKLMQLLPNSFFYCNKTIKLSNMIRRMERKETGSRRLKLKYAFIKISSPIKQSRQYIGLFCSKFFNYSNRKISKQKIITKQS